VIEDFERCYRAMRSRDARFDGWFYVGVTSTGIYCRPSCPALTPKRDNVRFYSNAAAAQGAGFRACKRCRPDASPGSPEWEPRGDLVARAARLISDGVVDREGVAGLARRLHFSGRHLHRALVAEVGAGPQALARAHRAETARLLIEATDLPVTDVVFASGFGSVRQFNDTVRRVFGCTPTELRRRRGHAPSGSGAIHLRLPFRHPFDGAGVLAWFGARAVAGVEEWSDGVYRRTLRLPHGAGTVALRAAGDHVSCELHLGDLRDLRAAVQRCRRLLDLDADPVAIAEALGGDPVLGATVRANPGRRVPGAAHGDEVAMRAVLGQQISLAGARGLGARLVARFGEPLPRREHGLGLLWPEPAALADADPATLRMPRARAGALLAVARALAHGDLVLDAGADREAVREGLLALPGIGPWTADYVAMRALHDPDAWPANDLGIRRGLARLGIAGERATADAARAWRPWRAYAAHHLWSMNEEERDGS
jgi:AraC family transcriptional regulator, regulatory protein of adaptative response / DNA-3-methyladenine glycosylase II